MSKTTDTKKSTAVPPSSTSFSGTMQPNSTITQGSIFDDDFVSAPTQVALISELNYAHEKYQRSLDEGSVRRIGTEWNKYLATPPILGLRDDLTLWVLDGQQHIQAAQRRGVQHVHGVVIKIDDEDFEAWLFTRLNTGGKNLNARQIYRSRLGWGELITTSIEEALEVFDLTGLRRSPQASIDSVAELRKAYTANTRLEGSKWDKTTIIDAAFLERGHATLTWAIQAGQPFHRGRGENANQAYRKEIVKALIWIRQNTLAIPDVTEIEKIFTKAKLTSDLLAEIINERTGGGGSTGGDARVLPGVRLADWINRQAGGAQKLIDLDAHYWQKLALHRAKVSALSPGSDQIIRVTA